MKLFFFFFLFVFSLFSNNDVFLYLKNKNIKDFSLIMDNTSKDDFPRRYRHVEYNLCDGAKDSKTDKADLLSLRMSGSGQFSPTQWQHILQDLKTAYTITEDDIYVIDLREEPHLFVDDYSVTLSDTNHKIEEKKFDPFLGLSSDDVIAYEQELKDILKKNNKLQVFKTSKKYLKKMTRFSISTKNIKTEREVVQATGAHYIRFSVTDHKKPTDALMDEFIRFYKNLPKKAWLHFHCRGGVGRTSSFMLMIDILKNAKKGLSLEAIIERNEKIGGSRKIFDMSVIKSNKLEDGLVRRDFLVNFYQYVINGYDEMTWSQWLMKNP